VKILVLSDRVAPFHAGGAARVAAALAGEYQRVGHDVVVVHGDPANHSPHDGRIGPLKAHWINAPMGKRSRGWLSIRNRRALGPLSSILAAEKPDVVHAHNLHEVFSFAALDLLAEANVPTVLTLHDCMTFHQGKFVEIAHRPQWRTDDAALRVSAWDVLRRYRFRYVPGRTRRIRRIIERSRAHVVSVSNLHRRVLAANRILCHDVVHNGVRVEAFRATPEAVERFRERFGVAGHRVVATFGRLTQDKGRTQILEAMQLVRRQVPGAVLLTVGTSTDSLPPEARAIAIGTPHLSGPELAAAYATAELVVVPSRCFESFGNVAVEAMAAGTPAIVSSFAGVGEIIEEGKTGFILDPMDVDALADRISHLLDDRTMAAQIGEAGRALIEKGFTLRQCAERYLGILDELVCSRRG